MGGGGGDGGYEAKQQDTERKKQYARDQLNVLFGKGSVDPAAIADSFGPAPQRQQYTRTVGGEYVGNGLSDNVHYQPVTETIFDDAGYNQAMAERDAKVRERQAALTTNGQSRDSLYQSVRENAFTAGKRGLDENFQDATRKNKFELFARGLAGGSEDIDQNARLKRTYNTGLMDLGAKADAAKAGFRNADEEARLQLLQSIDNGMDAGSALSSATSRMAVAADQAAADAQGTSVGNLFDTAGLLYTQSQAAKGRQAATDWWNQYSSPGKKPGSGAQGTLYSGPGV